MLCCGLESPRQARAVLLCWGTVVKASRLILGDTRYPQVGLVIHVAVTPLAGLPVS